MSPSSGHEWESKVKLVHGSIQTAEDGGAGVRIKGILWCVYVSLQECRGYEAFK